MRLIFDFPVPNNLHSDNGCWFFFPLSKPHNGFSYRFSTGAPFSISDQTSPFRATGDGVTIPVNVDVQEVVCLLWG
jgi:hypothetical protein